MTEYALQVWPHANPRYAASLCQLALSETNCLIRTLSLDTKPELMNLGGSTFIVVRAPADERRLAEHLNWMSFVQMIALLKREENGVLLQPVDTGIAWRFPRDIAEVLKYKGKTNASFTMLLLNLALYAGDYYEARAPRILDPLCGRGTGLFIAMCRGFDAIGIDRDGADITMAVDYLKRYLEYHRLRHEIKRDGMTLPGGKNAPRIRFILPAAQGTADASLQISFIETDTLHSGKLMRPAVHAVIADLPYGVQHAGSLPLKVLVCRAFPAWLEAMLPGAGLAVAFNEYTLPRAHMISAARDAGFEVLDLPPYNGFSHWVEQAVQRDILIARKPARIQSVPHPIPTN